MNWNDILKENQLLYSSESRDKVFRKLRLREQLYAVQYYRIVALTALDSAIIETLQFNGGELNDLEFAEILGFSVVDNFQEKRYKDPAEKEIFDQMMKTVAEYSLIAIHDHTITLQPLGYQAIADGVKYEFYYGHKPLMEFFDLNPKNGEFNKTFPFYEALGLSTPLREAGKLKYDEFNNSDVLNTILHTQSPLIDQFNLQSEECPNIFKAYLTEGEFIQEKRIHDIEVDFRIYQYERKIYPVVYYKNSPCKELNEILWNNENNEFLQEKRLQGMYHYTVRKTNAPLNLTTLHPYYNYWQIAELISNERYVWSDKELFDLIQDKSTGNDWTQISKRCPLPDLYEYIPQYQEMWEWTVLSHRCEDNFVSTNIAIYPWDVALLSIERDVEFLKPLIIQPELVNLDWDWEEIIPKLDIPFIIDHLSVLDIELTWITPNVLESYPQALLDHPDKKWDWNYISQEAPLQFVLNNLSVFGTSLHLEEIVDRGFKDNTYANSFCLSKILDELVTNQGLKASYSANLKEYVWSPKLIDWLENHQLVSWISTPNKVGLECNPYLVWDTAFFERYKHVGFSEEGWNHISRFVTNTNVIKNNDDLKWNWEVLSDRDIVEKDYDFIIAEHNKLNLATLLPKLSPEIIGNLYEDGVLAEYLSYPPLQSIITKYLPRDVIVRHISDNWDWIILTHRFCATLNIDNFGHAKWIDKWDWNYLSENFDIEIIKHKIDLYIDRWNWSILTTRLGHDFVIDNLPEYSDYWDWNLVIKEVLNDDDFNVDKYLPMIATCANSKEETESKEIWTNITARLTTDQAIEIIAGPYDRTLFHFDYNDIYNRRDFIIEEYLEKCESNRRIYVDWKALSRSRALNLMLTWDKKIVKDFKVWINKALSLLTDRKYAWDFKYLSQQSSINWCDSILKTRTEEWDWDYICQHSQMFHGSKNIVKHIRDFENYINFEILSEREDLILKAEDLEKVANNPWSWSKLSKHTGISITTEFVLQHENLDWDWYAISGRKDFKVPFTYIYTNKERNWNWEAISNNKNITFDCKQFLELQDKEWNWSAISQRADILFVEDVVKSLHTHPLDWNIVTKRDDFKVSLASLAVIPQDEIDWRYLSSKPDLSFEVINKYKEAFDWEILTKNSCIDIANKKYLETFYDYLDWSYVSKSTLLKIDKETLEAYKYYLDWKQISRRSDFDISLVEEFEDYIDWSYFSRATQIKLTPELIERYAEKWDWIELAQNINFAEYGLNDYYSSKMNIVKFYQNIRKENREPAIYHFSHMFNAIEIIRSRKILSRNKAQELGLLKYDAAGSVVYRTAKAHPYARFYFRTGTQTQFYNECLGKSVGNKYYKKAEQNGLPMCPMPVFFKFDLQEVLTTYGEDCYYSTGNMQSNSACVRSVVKHPNGLTVHTLFSNGHSKEEQEKRQQEFLIPDEFDFSRLKNYQIICYSRTQRQILEAMFEGDSICEHFVSVESPLVEDVFLKENPRLEFHLDEDHINISTNYDGDYHFQIIGDDLSGIRVGERKNTIKDNKNEISFKSHVDIEQSGEPFEIYYICDNQKARSKKWLIYKQ